ncbi:NUDIX hydrolase [Sphingomonas solaris]|uniref:NUDIX hydrolase n=1 Tax=Alterirhizorhabdus solaris TaxID=2529389 RepID=A0A558R4R9_9SPHN|nr:NUDIX domain-containing protein [Sphingomonas solaris]TVV74376.1 NUDIX hydrolase [Sphingomonas solaris]
MTMMIPAATLVLFRPGADGVAEVLMMERAGGMAFAAGAMVFPGGRVDPGDHAVAAGMAAGCDPESAVARVAAVRETIEEVGIAVGLVPAPDAASVARLRAGLAAGQDFGGLLAGEGLRLEADALTPFARWRPNAPERRNFDTLFFVAEAPADAIASADGGESVRVTWATPQALLDAADAGHHHVIFPTRRNLERLAQLSTIAIARAHAADHPVTVITPFLEMREGEEWLCIPEGCGYPVTAEPMSRVRRG